MNLEEFLNTINIDNRDITAKELLEKYRFEAGPHIGNRDYDKMCEFAIEFADYHVNRALKSAANSATISYDHFDGMSAYINRSSILNAYPLENIK